MKKPDIAGPAAGFTLMELIIVILILGVLGTMGAQFIATAFKGFHATDIRTEIYEEGKIALMRMERELHIALPNAVEVAGDGISFGVIDESAMAGVFGRHTEPDPSGGTTITDYSAALANGTLVSIYNTGWADFSGGGRLYRVVGLPGGAAMTLNTAIAASSPYSRRYFAVRDQAVRFRVAGGTLWRDTATVNENGIPGSFADSYPLARDVTPFGSAGYFSYAPGTAQRNAVVNINFAIQRDGETVGFHKEVRIRNVP